MEEGKDVQKVKTAISKSENVIRASQETTVDSNRSRQSPKRKGEKKKNVSAFQKLVSRLSQGGKTAAFRQPASSTAIHATLGSLPMNT